MINKPAGLLSQGERKGDPNVVDWLRTRLGRPYVGLVHRLDRNTSGVMVIAKRTKAASRLTEALQKGELSRTYLAYVVGKLQAPMRWSHELRKDEARNLVRVVASLGAGTRGGTGARADLGTRVPGKAAVLVAKPLSYASWRGLELTRVEFELETGRSHQIRVQAAHEGYPLLGDSKYSPRGIPRASLEFGRPALHSWKIRFPHPISREILSFDAPLPPDMRAITGSL